jgi:ubiquinone biosynthesis protein
MRTVCEPIFQKPLSDISFGQLLLQLFRTAGRFNMEVQPSLVLLQKTLLNIEGLGKQLYPDLDLWQTALPFLEKWQRDRLSPLANLRKVREKFPEWLEQVPEIPELVFRALQEQGSGSQRLREATQRIRQLEQAQASSNRRVSTLTTLLVIAVMAAFYAALVK